MLLIPDEATVRHNARPQAKSVECSGAYSAQSVRWRHVLVRWRLSVKTTSVASRIRCRRLRAAIGVQRKAHRAANTERIGKRCNAAMRFDCQRRPPDAGGPGSIPGGFWKCDAPPCLATRAAPTTRCVGPATLAHCVNALASVE